MRSGLVSRFALCLTLALACPSISAVSAASVHPEKDPMLPRVRGVTPKMRELIQIGISRSTTFRELVETLNASDVVVFLETRKDLPLNLNGRLVFMTAAGRTRYLHAQLTPGLSEEDLIAVAAHELQHAVEVATHPEVKCAETLRGLYQRIGIPSVVKNRYDTAAAQSTGRRVRAELG